MRKGIIADLDMGIYKAAREAKVTSMSYFSNLVMEKLAKDGKDSFGRDIDVVEDVRKHQEWQLRALGVPNDDSSRARTIKAHALDNYGLYKEMAARGIHPERDHAGKFFEAELNTPLFPQFVANALIIGLISGGLLPELVFADVRTDRLSYDKVRLNEAEDARKLRNVGIGETLPLTELSHVDARIPVRKYGRRFMYAREVILFQPLPIVSAFLGQLGKQLAVDETDEALEILHAGDGENPSNAVTDTTPAVDGTLAYADLVKLDLAFTNAYAMRVGVADATSFQTILNMAEYKNPLANRDVELVNDIPSVPTPSRSGRIFRWNSTGSTYMAESGGRIAAADGRMAAYVVRSGDLLQEAENLIESGKQQVAMSYLMSVVKADPKAFNSLDVTA